MGMTIAVIVSLILGSVISQKVSGSKMFSDDWFGRKQMAQWHGNQARWNEKYPNDKHPTGKITNEYVNTDWVTNPTKWNREHPDDQHLNP